MKTIIDQIEKRIIDLEENEGYQDREARQAAQRVTDTKSLIENLKVELKELKNREIPVRVDR